MYPSYFIINDVVTKGNDVPVTHVHLMPLFKVAVMASDDISLLF
jgi:hypothetical protein